MTHDEYYRQCIAEAAEECCAMLTKEQINHIADAVKGGIDEMHMVFGSADCSGPSELDRTKELLEKERKKTHCHKCNGTGRIWTSGPIHGSDEQCWKCNGEGKISP